MSKNDRNIRSPSREQVGKLMDLYNRGALSEALDWGETLAKQFPQIPGIQHMLGAINIGLGRLQQAAACYQAVLKLKPDFAEAHNNLGNVLGDLGRLEDAALSYRRALRVQPGYAAAHINLGATLSDLGQLEAAVTSYHNALSIEPNAAVCHNNLGVTLTKLGRPEEAVSSLNRALQIEPDSADAHNNLGNALADLGETDRAAHSFRSALQIQPGFSEAQFNLGNTLKTLGKLDEAVACYQETLRVTPDHAGAHNNLGAALMDLGKLREATHSFQNALQTKPDYAEAHTNLGAALNELGHPEQAVVHHNKALHIKSDYADGHTNLGVALFELGRYDEAATSHGKALRIDPQSAGAHNNLATALYELDQVEEALSNYEKALQIDPEYAEAYRNLSLAKRFQTDDHQVSQMLAMIDRDNLPDHDRMHLFFALGKAFDDILEFDRSFDFFAKGNQIKRRTISYQSEEWQNTVSKLKRVFDADLFDRRKLEGVTDEAPVFIVGLPRSGKTTVEKILSQHQDFFGAGEFRDLEQAISSSLDMAGFPGNIHTLSRAQYGEIGKKYLSTLRRRSSTARFVCNTMPTNFAYLGMIKLILPHARIIHCQRDPRDNCLSIFQKYFASGGHGYAYDLTEIGQYYLEYSDLMEHWNQVLPDFIHNIEFEALASGETGALADFLQKCGLNHEGVFEQPCSNQAQQRLTVDYQRSIQAWRHYERQLQPLFQAMGTNP